MKIGLGRGRVDVERGTKRDDGEEEEAGDANARRRAADPRDPKSRSFWGQDLRYILGLSTFCTFCRILSSGNGKPAKGRSRGRRGLERASHRKGGGSGERGKRASGGDRGASVDAGKDEKLPLSSGGGGNGDGVAVSVSGGGGGVRGIAFFLPFPSSSLFPRRKWPLDVTVIILRASLARKNERTREREKERESDARTAAAAPTKMPVGGGREGGKGQSERASGEWVGWLQLQPSERGRKRERLDRNRGTGSSEEEHPIWACLDF